MTKVRLMDTLADYKKLGISDKEIEMWEDERRDDDRSGHWEWWYFDAIMDDGTAVVIQFLQKSAPNVLDNIAHPTVSFKITLPDGTAYNEMPSYSIDECAYGSGKCDVAFGPNKFQGDLKNYHLHVDPVNGIAADLKLTSLTQPFRPGTGYFDFGNDGQDYYTWLCVVPKGEVSGTLTIAGKTINVHGYGYHDHQWGSMNYIQAWNNWTWARQSFDDYTLLVFDMISSKASDYQRFPLAFIQDKNGKIIFENTKDADYQVLNSYYDDSVDKEYPKISQYKFNQNDIQVTYRLSVLKTLETMDAFLKMPQPQQESFSKLGLHPTYARYLSKGELKIESNDKTIERSGELINEFMYPGLNFK